MMNKAQSARVHLIRFLFLLPLLVVVLLAFRNAAQTRREPLRTLVTDTVPAPEKVPAPPPPPPVPAVEVRVAPKKPVAPAAPKQVNMEVAPEAAKAPQSPVLINLTPVPPPPPRDPLQDCYNQKGYCVSVVDNRGEATVIVKDKANKIVLAVSLNDWNKDKQYEDKYGEVPPRQILLLPKTVMGNKLRLKTIRPVAVKNEENIIAVKPYTKLPMNKYLPMYSVTPDGNVTPVIFARGYPGYKGAAAAKSGPSPYVKMAEAAKDENIIATNKKMVAVRIVTGEKAATEANGAADANPQVAAVKKSTTLINLTPVAKPAAEAKETITVRIKREAAPKPAEANPAAPTKEQ